MKQHIQHEIQSALHLHQALLTDETLHLQLQNIVLRSVQALQNNHKIWLCGNGGSAADAMHLAAELAGRFYQDRKPLPAEVLATNFAFATAVANDYNYETVYTRALHAQARRGDLLWRFLPPATRPIYYKYLQPPSKWACKPSALAD
jgi:D-sedoheptulose 7-phosphate isomerase